LKNLRTHLEEISFKLEHLDPKEQFVPDFNKLELNLKKVMEEVEQFKDITKFTDLIEENKKSTSKKVDDMKQKVEKIEREYTISLQSQIAILRDKLHKLEDAHSRSNKELNNLTQQLEDQKKIIDQPETKFVHQKIIEIYQQLSMINLETILKLSKVIS